MYRRPVSALAGGMGVPSSSGETTAEELKCLSQKSGKGSSCAPQQFNLTHSLLLRSQIGGLSHRSLYPKFSLHCFHHEQANDQDESSITDRIPITSARTLQIGMFERSSISHHRQGGRIQYHDHHRQQQQPHHRCPPHRDSSTSLRSANSTRCTDRSSSSSYTGNGFGGHEDRRHPKHMPRYSNPRSLGSSYSLATTIADSLAELESAHNDDSDEDYDTANLQDVAVEEDGERVVHSGVVGNGIYTPDEENERDPLTHDEQTLGLVCHNLDSAGSDRTNQTAFDPRRSSKTIARFPAVDRPSYSRDDVSRSHPSHQLAQKHDQLSPNHSFHQTPGIPVTTLGVRPSAPQTLQSQQERLQSLTQMHHRQQPTPPLSMSSSQTASSHRVSPRYMQQMQSLPLELSANCDNVIVNAEFLDTYCTIARLEAEGERCRRQEEGDLAFARALQEEEDELVRRHQQAAPTPSGEPTGETTFAGCRKFSRRGVPT